MGDRRCCFHGNHRTRTCSYPGTMKAVWVLGVILLGLLVQCTKGCPEAKRDCLASQVCQWSDELKRCESSLPCVLESSQSECLANTWQCNWNSESGTCSTIFKTPDTTFVSPCRSFGTKLSCGGEKTCIWRNGACTRRPTLVLSISDDLSHYDVSWTNPRARSPVLEKLRSHGMDLTRFYTSRFCAPSRAMFMTGRYPWRLGLQTDLNLNPSSSLRCGVDLSLKLLPHYLKESGNYATHAFGKWHLGQASDAHLPTSRGFDTYIGWLGGGLSATTKPNMFYSKRCTCLGRPVGFCNPYLRRTRLACARGTDVVNATSKGALAPVFPSQVKEDHADLFIANQARNLILASKDRDPLFLYLSWSTPHTPYAAPERFRLSRQYSKGKFGSNSLLYKTKCNAVRRETQLAMIGVMDEAHRIVLDALDRMDRYESAIIIFSSDNGGNIPRRLIKTTKAKRIECNFGMNFPLRGSKFTWYEGGIRVIAFASSVDYIHPSRKGTVYSGLMAANDVVATLLGASGAKVDGTEFLGDSVDHWESLSKEIAPALSARQELPLQVWLETNRFAILYHHDGVLFKIIRGYPWSGTGPGNIGAPQPQYALSDIFQPWELPSAELGNCSVQQPKGRVFECNPHCLYDVQNDFQELWEISGTNLEALQAGQILIGKYRAEGVDLGSSNLCVPGFYPLDNLDVTDRVSIDLARQCYAFLPWLNANLTQKTTAICGT